MVKMRTPVKVKVLAVTGFLIVAGFCATVLSGHSLAETWAQATTRQSDYFTSLGFVNTGHLPLYSPAGKAQNVTFRLANHEAMTQTYHYIGLMTTNSKAQTVAQGAITLKPGETTDQKVSFTVPQPEMTVDITIQLTGRTEYITFEAKS